MAFNFYIDNITKDLTLDDAFNLRFTSNIAEYTAQKIEAKLQIFKGEWYLNRDLGLPFYESFFVKNPDLGFINSVLITEITSVDTVDSLIRFDSVFNTGTRSYNVAFTSKLINNENLDGEFTI